MKKSRRIRSIRFDAAGMMVCPLDKRIFQVKIRPNRVRKKRDPNFETERRSFG
jgi:hypothetical protein